MRKNNHISFNLIVRSFILFITLIVQLNYFAQDGDSTNLIYPIEDGYDPSQTDGGLINFDDPLNFNNEVQYDPVTGKYVFTSKVGDNINYRPPSSMTLEEYLQYQNNQSMDQYWQDRVDEQVEEARDEKSDDNSFRPKINAGKSVRKIFGSDFIEIRPQGSAELSFGLNISKTENPIIPVKQRRITTFDFDQQIQMNLTGKIGDLMQIGFNYNTEATFDFDNQLKLDYSGEEDDIIQKIEAGNVSMPLNSSLITGSQSLFGLKTELKFGRLTTTTVLSQQKGEKKEIEVSGGAQVNDFELYADNYEENRHFFLNYHFYDSYDESLKTLPVVTSGIQIQRMEVWITNKTNDYDETRNIIAFSDLGESKNGNMENSIWNNNSSSHPDNDHNTLYSNVLSNAGIRDYASASNILSGTSYNMTQSVEFEKLQNARLLTSSQYTYNSLLGFISLNQSLNNDEVLAVAYQYTYKGETFQVGEFSTDGIAGKDALYLKLLKSTVRNPLKKLWKLMMKNVYSLGAYQIDSENFRLDIIYTNPSNGIDINYIPKQQVQTKLLTQLLSLDNLNQQLALNPDGIFDFVPIQSSNGVISNAGTINPRNGRVYFTTVEPFGKTLDTKLADEGVSQNVRNTIVFNALYDSTVTAARQIPELNRFKIAGTYQSSVSSEISLNALNIPEGSVVVTAGGRVLQEGTHYTVDYNLGRVSILDDGILSSGTPIKISLESNSLFSIQTKSLIGTHLDYRINKNANIGATVMHLTEKPLTQKVNIGDEPISNTMLGLDGGFKREVPLLTKLIDKIPLINTKAKSSISFSGEVAALIPGHNKAIGEDGTSYIDAFEASQSAIDIRSYNSWVMASVPQGQNDLFPEGIEYNDLKYGKNRARIAWHVVEPLFSNNSNPQTPDYIKDSEIQKDNRVRQVLVSEVFPNQQLATGDLTNIPVFDINYYPSERGPYNFDANPTTISAGANASTGGLNNPASRWAGIMRPLTTNDFEAANVEFIQFWVMDPFSNTTSNVNGVLASNEDSENTTGGDLYFNLGNISEDILKDGQKSFENGLPADGVYDPQTLTTTAWGRIPTTQVVVNAFDNDPTNRLNQDVGLDGLISDDEGNFFTDYLNDISAIVTNQTALQQIIEDPSSDDYNYFLDDDYDAQQEDILTRYKKFNNPEGNSPSSVTSASLNSDGYGTSASTMPNVEDINRDNNLNETESYFQYKVSMRPQDMVVGKNFITDRILATDKNSGKEVFWYQFRIPIREYDKRVNNIQDFRAIRFMRMFMHGWSENAVLRFARLDLIRGQWRSYGEGLLSAGEYIQGEESNTSFVINAVNIEQNSDRSPIKYILPDGIERQVNYQTANLAQLNEQSLVLDVCGLQDGDARAAYKNVNFDVRNYNQIEMFVHAEDNIENGDVGDGDATVFIRLGTDFVNNYYEYEMPLKMSPWKVNTSESIWPEENNMLINLADIKQVKKNRNSLNYSDYTRYTEKDPSDNTRNITVIGNPNLQNLKTIMIGVRNPKKDDPDNLGANDDGLEKCVEVWVNELRLTDFNQQGGWATIGRLNAQLADFADVSLSGNYSTPYFGGIDQSVGERQQEYVYGVDASTTVQLGKFFGNKTGLQLPMYMGFSNNTTKPLYDPMNPDLAFEKNAEETDEEWKERFENGSDITKRKSLNFTNVRFDPSANKEKDPKKIKKPHFYDVKNFSASYSYNEITHVDINTQLDRKVSYAGGLTYGFSNSPKPWEPFKRKKAFRKSKWLRPIKDFNLYLAPKKLGFRTTMDRTYNEYEIRSNLEGGITVPNYNKTFNWDRDYDLKYDLTKSLKFDFTAKNRAFIDESFGKVDYGAFGYDEDTSRIKVNESLENFGETMNYGHTTNLSYKWPLNKFPITNWMSLNTRYSANFDWTRAPLANKEIGNIVQNSRVIQWNAKLNMTSLYNKVPYLKKVNQKANKRKTTTRRGSKQPPTKPDPKAKNSKTKNNQSKFNILEEAAKIVMSLKNVSGTYATNDGILLPGFNNNTDMLGFDENFKGQSWQFVTGGFQEYDLFGRETGYNYAEYAESEGWLVDSSKYYSINTQYAVTHTEKLNLKATLKPIKGLRIDLTANYNVASNNTSNLGYDDTGEFELQNQLFTGSFSKSIVSWKTAFVGDKGDDSDDLANATFDNLLEIRKEVSQLIATGNTHSDTTSSETGYEGGYSGSQQDVVIGAFLAAYTGQSVNDKSINPFRKMPLPNWRISYDGLSKVKWIKKYVRTISFSHAYRSNFSMGSYTTNLGYADNNDDGMSTELDMAGNFISENQIMNVSITEQFQPLLGVNLTLKSGIKAKVEIKKDRNIALSLSNNQITEIKGSEIVIGSGYTFKKLQLPIKFNSKKIDPSDLTTDLSISVRDNKTITRKIVEEQNQATAGQKLISIKFNAQYNLSKSLMIRAYYDRVVNKPVISTSFPTANTKAGFALRFMLQ